MRVALFIPCYINAVYPSVGIASYKLLESLGVEVEYPEGVTCCGQPMANAGYQGQAKELVDKFESAYAGYDYVVGPSASCVAFVKEMHPLIAEESGHICTSAGKVRDIVEFLHDDLKVSKLAARFPHRVSIHNSCHGVRELGLSTPSECVKPYHNKVRSLLELVEGIEVFEPERIDECCGFGGMFSTEEHAVSCAMGRDKVEDHMSTGAEYITGPDSSCLMHMQGVIDRERLPIKTLHCIEILAANL